MHVIVCVCVRVCVIPGVIAMSLKFSSTYEIIIFYEF